MIVHRLDISGVLSTTYQNIDVQLLSDLLGGLEGKHSAAFIKAVASSIIRGLIFIYSCSAQLISFKIDCL